MKYKPLTSVKTPFFVIGHPFLSSVTFRSIPEKSGFKPVAHTIEETVMTDPLESSMAISTPEVAAPTTRTLPEGNEFGLRYREV